MEILSVREHPELLERAIAYFQEKWASPESAKVYDDSIRHSMGDGLPEWYLLLDGDVITGCCGLISNDFVSRMDLMPYLCALYVEEAYRGRALGSLLIEQTKRDARRMGFSRLYLATDHVGYYEKYGFVRIAAGYHPWGEESSIYEAIL